MYRATGLKRPDYARMRVDIENGTRVTLDTNHYGVIRGTVRCNPKERAKQTYLFLADTVFIDHNGLEGRNLGLIRVDQEDIKMYLKMDHVPKTVREKDKIEKLLSTVVVDSTAELSKLVERLKTTNEVGINFYGKEIGRRDPKLSFIAICFENTMFVVDTIALSTLWVGKLKEFFESEKICKVLYNSVPSAKHLHEYHGIKLNSVVDLQVFDFSVRYGENLVNTQQPVVYKYLSLHDLLAFRLGDKIINTELTFLKEFENQDFSERLLRRPFGSDRNCCKLIALEMKYLLDLKKELTLPYERQIQYMAEVRMREEINEGLHFRREINDTIPGYVRNAVESVRRVQKGKIVETKSQQNCRNL